MQFPDGFLWGVADSAFQVEGATREDGRTESVWDRFCRIEGAIAGADHGDVAIDRYHRYESDIGLMRELGAGAYSFTISWPRVQPHSGGAVNTAGLEYYLRLVDCIHANGLKAVATLYHWDHPQWLQEAGGWDARDTAFRFAEYAGVIFSHLGAKVDMWITMNEPYCVAILGHLEGIHAPGIRSRPTAYRAIHHLLLAHGLAVQAYRDTGLSAPIGIVHNTVSPRPATAREEDLHAADRAADLRTRMFLDPLLGRGYPSRHLDVYPELRMPVVKGDFDIIGSEVDFLGLDYYEEDACCYDEREPEKFRSVPQYQTRSAMDWPVVPEGLERHLKWLHDYTGGLPLYVTENGAAFDDVLSEDGSRCHDAERVQFLRDHVAAMRRAMDAGVDVRGYFVWSFTDNFEWSLGYAKRFGLVYCDYRDLRRVAKDSFYFYRDLIAGTVRL